MAEAKPFPDREVGERAVSSGQWAGSDRRDRLPPDWAQRRKRVLRRDGHKCQWVKTSGQLCLQPANQVDHRNPGDDHSNENLQALCEWHHLKKSGGEGGRASYSRRRSAKNRLRRPTIADPRQL